MKDHARADIHTAAHAEPHAVAGRYALKEDAAHGEPMQEQYPGRNCDLWMTHAGAVFAEVLYPVERTLVETGVKCEKEGVAEMKC